MRRGATRHFGGIAAEDAAAAAYAARGFRVLARRLRTPEGEIDLVLTDGAALVFAEVKSRRVLGPDSPISRAQWRRLERSAQHYMMVNEAIMGAVRFCRFDAVLVGPDGTVGIVENAWSFDEQ